MFFLIRRVNLIDKHIFMYPHLFVFLVFFVVRVFRWI